MTDDAEDSADSGDTAAKILRAARDLMSDKGYKGASMQEVATRAGVNKALVFYYYGSKEKLFDEVINGYYAEQMKSLQGALVEGADRRAQLHQLLDRYVDFLEANPNYPRLVQQELARSDGRHDLIRENNRTMFELVSSGLEGIAAPEGPRSAKHVFLSFAAMCIFYFTNAPALASLWTEEGEDPLSREALDERRQHLHWMADVMLDRLVSPAEGDT